FFSTPCSYDLFVTVFSFTTFFRSLCSRLIRNQLLKINRIAVKAATLLQRWYGPLVRHPLTSLESLVIREEKYLVPPVEYMRNQKDRKSTPLNSSHVAISYAVFCLK